MPASREDWGRVGRMLAARRVQISARYANRRVFADESGLNWRLLYDAERGRRATFKTETVRAFETAYRLEPWSLDTTLAGGPLKPLPAPAEVAVPRQAPGSAPLAAARRFMSEQDFRDLVLPDVTGPARLDCEEVLALEDADGDPLPWPRRREILSWRLFDFPELEGADRRICEEILKLTDREGRRLPWLGTPDLDGKWDYVGAVRAMRARRHGREAGLIPPPMESELVINPHAMEIARRARQIRRKPCGPLGLQDRDVYRK